MTEFSTGDVVRYSYLWGREFDRGEDAGRKIRPSCVMIVFGEGKGRKAHLFFPITSQPPGSDTPAVIIPEIEARRVKLRLPAWVVVNEFNSDDPKTSYAVEDAEPLGAFSRRFVAKIASEAAKAMRAGKSRAIPRE